MSSNGGGILSIPFNILIKALLIIAVIRLWLNIH